MDSREPSSGKVRLASLDALRGFDMFFIVGGFQLIAAVAGLFGADAAQVCEQLDHVPWHGLHLMDVVFPLFLFLAGFSFVFSCAKSRSKGLSDGAIALKCLRRGVILFALGILYGNFLSFDFGHFRVWSVLGRIGVAWTLSSWIYLRFGCRARVAIAVGILAAVTLFTLFVPTPGAPAGFDPFSREWNFGSWMDRTFTTNHICYWMSDPEGFSGLLPSVVTAMLGVFAGEIVCRGGVTASWGKAGRLLALGAALGIAGWLLSHVFPVNKSLWSPSYVLVVGGISAALAALFYGVIDVMGCGRWAFFFRVIGLNSITIYLLCRFVDFSWSVQRIFGGLAGHLPPAWGEFVMRAGLVALVWLVLYFLYRKKAFLKV